MSRIIGDRTKSALDEMEEVARERNRDVAEEEKLEKLEAAKRAREEARKPKSSERSEGRLGAQATKAPPAPVIIPASGIGDIEYDAELITGNWASCVSQAKAENLEIATARQIAELRIKHGKNSVYCTKGCWVAENFNYLPSGDILVASADYNPNFKYAEKATSEHIAGNEFYLDDKIVAELLQGIKQGSVLLLKRKDVPDKISVDSFGKEPLTAFLGWNEDYGDFLKGCGIEKVKLYVAEEAYAKEQGKAFSRALLAANLYSNSALLGNDYGLNFGCAFGVRRSAKNPAGNGGSQ